jgi:predicted O-methyltransferase YrrM
MCGRNLLLMLALSTASLLFCHQFTQKQPVSILSSSHKAFSEITETFNTFGIDYVLVDHLTTNADHLFIIFDLDAIPAESLPAHFIAYQTLDLTTSKPSADYIQKLSKAVAVWDFSNENIAQYSALVHHYYYFPAHYEFVDPIILVCLLPTNALATYRNLLAYSNQFNTDISSHLPTIFCYSLLQNPKMMVEAGVRGGESTIPLREVLNYIGSQLIGIDIDPASANVYAKISNSRFLCMDDRNFEQFYTTNINHQPIDLIFIDTSHEYLHTLQELAMFEKLLAENGIILLHDSNVTPLNNNTGYMRLNGTIGHATGNTRGVTQAIKEFFNLSFDEYHYSSKTVIKNGLNWEIIHYPFCNGLTILRKM